MDPLLRELLDMPIIGNAHDDRPLFDLADRIVMRRTSPMSHKIAALRKIDQAMGVEPKPICEGDVEEYESLCRDYHRRF